jgi:ABC-type transport system involved in multi-copper enzyme maturation permease subunit
MLLSLIRAEVFKLSRRAMPRILLLILVLGVIGLYGLLWVALETGSQADDPGTREAMEDLRELVSLDQIRESGTDLVVTLGSILAVILGASAISTEYTWGTIRTILPRAGSRAGFLTAKYLVLAGFVVLIMLVGFLAALLGSFIVSTAEDLGRDLGPDAAPGIAAALARGAFVTLPYVALAFLVAVQTRSTAAGISVGLVVLLGEGIVTELIALLPGALERVPGFLLSRNVTAVMDANAVGEGSAEPLPNIWRATAVLSAYTAAFVALAYRVFLTRDVTAGGE